MNNTATEPKIRHRLAHARDCACRRRAPAGVWTTRAGAALRAVVAAGGVLVAISGADIHAAPGAVPGMWGTTDTSQPAAIEWPANWYGERNLRAQWWKILADSPSTWKFENHAKGEPPGNTYYLWRFDKPLPEGTKLLIEGDFPHARMMSLQVCAPWSRALPSIGDGTGIPEVGLLDEDIVPDPGHTNPYLVGANRQAPKRHFHVTFELRDGNPAELNPKAAVPPYRAPGNLRVGCRRSGKDGQRGPFVWVRVYLPDRYDPYGGVEPPVLRLQLPGQKPELAPITREIELNLMKEGEPYSAAENPALPNDRSVKEVESLEWLRDWTLEGLKTAGEPGDFVPDVYRFFSPRGELRLIKFYDIAYYIGWLKHIKNPDACRTRLPKAYAYLYGKGQDRPPPANDEHSSGHAVHNSYLSSGATLKPGQLLVFRGKAPNTPRTLAGDKTMGSSEQLRYWGITLQAGRPTKLAAVISIVDEEVVLDADRNYTIVIGRKADRPANARAENGISWFEWPVGDALAILIRVMSTSATPWAHAPQRITWADTDYCDNNKWPTAVKQRMGEYFFTGRYMSRQEIESLGQGGRAPYTKPAAW